MVNKVLSTIEKWNMLKPGDRVLIGLSGGSDSVCLLHILWSLKEKLGISLFALHVHHGIRGAAADEDVFFCKDLCHQLEVPLTIEYQDVQKLALEQKLTVEEAGRKVRYQCLEDQAIVTDAKIAVAHHQKDQVETVLFNLMRGSGLKGLGGMQPVRGRIIRPLIECRKDEIEAFCREEDYPYREDTTNQETVYSRNKIRLELIPYIEEHFNARFVEQVAMMSDFLREDESFLESLATTFLEGCRKEGAAVFMGRKDLLEIPSVIRRRVYLQAMGLLNPSRKDIEAKHLLLLEGLLIGQTGKRLNLPYGILVENVYGELVFCIDGDSADEEPFAPKEIHLEKKGLDLGENGMLTWEILKKPEGAVFPENIYTKWFDYDKIKDTLTIRTRKDGDYIPLKGAGNKKLKDYFMDMKVPRGERDKILLLAAGSEIIWIIGYRINEHYKVNEQTKRIIQVRFIKEELHG